MSDFITFNAFIKREYVERCDNNYARRAYRKAGGIKAFKRKYISYNGFSDYLCTLKGFKLNTMQTYHLARMFYSYGKRSPNEIPGILVSISHQYNVDFPAVYGILTNEYWASRFDGPLYS